MFIKNMLAGLVIGIANIIPGVSGGTMAVVLNVYDQLIASISDIRKNFKANFMFLFAILSGAGLGIVLFSRGITFLLDNYYMITNFFFIGIIFGSMPMVLRRATADKFKPLHIIPCIITLIAMLVTVFFIPESQEVIMKTLTFPTGIKLFFISALAAICMIIPGISGSFVMLLFGVYETITTAISDMNILILLPIGFGALLGILSASKLIDHLQTRYPQATYFAIFGFMLGSIPAILNKINGENAYTGGWELVTAIIVLAFGFAISYLFSRKDIAAKRD